MLILAIDTSTKVATIALYSKEKGTVGEITINSNSNHSETIMGGIASLFKLTNMNIKDVNTVAVSIGPGSFTGIRIGVALAKGLAFSLNKSIVGINELEVLAALVNNEDKNIKIMPMIDARKFRVYYSLYGKNELGKLNSELGYLDGEILEFLPKYKNKKIIFVGDGAIAYKNEITKIMGKNAIFLSKALSLPRALILAELSLEKEKDNLITLEPFYISKTQAEREKIEKNKY
ncbi:MAG: tRNA (adenosine(37)-N6)-threonylcarbamoyltransferase complex dimerization subunit type 1 TsaB [Fusobacteriaceae bacterium]